MSVEPRAHARIDEICTVLGHIEESLDAASGAIRTDVEAALDDLLAARLMAATLLAKLRGTSEV